MFTNPPHQRVELEKIKTITINPLALQDLTEVCGFIMVMGQDL